MFKLTQEEFDYVKSVYDENVFGGILNNKRIITAFRILNKVPEDELVNVRYARKYIFNFFMYKWEYEIIEAEEPLSTVDKYIPYDDQDELASIRDEIKEKEQYYEENKDSLEKGEKISVKQKINKLYKKWHKINNERL